MMLTIMIIAYILQLSGFIFTWTQIDENEMTEKHSLGIFQPYFERIEISIMLFLTHFQYHAFYSEPIRIIKIISIDLKYANITKALVYTSAFISIYISTAIFIQIFQIFAGILLLILSVFIYYKLFLLN